MNIFNTTAARVLTAALLLQCAAYYALASRPERAPAIAPLSTFPSQFGGWSLERDTPLEKEIAAILRADDTVNRIYATPQQLEVSLFVAFFKTQRRGQSPHSPKNCMPGAGWQQLSDGKLSVSVPGRDAPVVVNRYVISRGDMQSLVLYWYQSHSRIVAGELSAKFWLVADAIQYGRSDTALVRIIVPVRENEIAAAEQTAVTFVQSAYPELVRHLPQ